MASRRDSKANGAQAKLLQMVNDQRARCKLTTLDDVMNHTGYSWVESMLEHARDLYQDHSTRIVSEADMNVNILRSPKKEKHKQKLPKKVTSSKKPSPYKKKTRIPKESTPPRLSPKKLSVTSSHNVSPSSSASTKVAQRDSTSSRGTLVDRPLQAKSLNTPLETSSALKVTTKITPEALIGQKEAAMTTMPAAEVASKEEVPNVAAEESRDQSARKRKSEVELEQVARKRPSLSVAESAVEEGPVLAEKEGIIVIDDTVEEKEVAAVEEERAPEAVTPVESVIEDDIEDSLSLVDEGEDSIEVSRVVTQRIEVNEAIEDKKDEEAAAAAADSSVEKEEIQSVDSDLRVEQSEPKKGVKDLKAVITQLRNSLDDTMSSNDTKSARSDDVFSEGEAEPVPSSSSSSSAPKPSLRERIDRFRAIFSPAPRPASSIPRLSPPKYSQSPPRPQLSNITKPGAKSVAVKPIEAKSTFRPVIAKAVEKFEPKSTIKAVEKEKPVEKVVTKPVEKAVEKSIEKTAEKREEKCIEKPMEKPKDKLTEKPAVKMAAKAIAPPSFIALASPPKSPGKKALESDSLIAPSAKFSRPLSPNPPSNAKHTTISQATKTAPSTSSSQALPPNVVAPMRGSSIKVAAPVPIRAPTQVKPAAVPVKAAPSQPAPAITLANPFQKAQQQQQQQVLAATSQLRTTKQAAAVPVPSTAHIELEEPDSAYSDSEDEETVRRRQQHKPWETREGLAKALEEQATVDADMIFGIPHGVVPIDEILPPETEHARAKRARPRSSSATWSRDGLKQIEIDRYNERMGIQGPGVLLPITVQDDGSGTPSRSHRLSAIAQSAVSQGQVSRKASFSAHRGSISPIRPGSVLSSYASNNLAPSTIKYPQLAAGTPNRAKATVANTASAQKAKLSKPASTVSASASKQPKPSTTKNPFQNGSSTLQSTSRLVSATTKTTSVNK